MNEVPRTAAPARTGRIAVDARWVELYAKRVDEAAEELSRARTELRAEPVRAQSFGELGRSLRSAEAYGRAAAMLNGQLDRACEVLTAAAHGLHAVAEHYGSQEDEAVALIKNADRR
ncbi:hypothetical protein ABZ816_21360 [Actinosynnema sp. NPDC047251]|uniref:PE domain-containing protein n=1 Tax=Saccharothrix espanaensis (strain ATCC 51144 / DSM 44229 / JCM 9112 / NBRC 15066 / NRRL 15764) TaxID=1179773 RepID=K0KED6_SACES|nr:hypothetical protein [Saccharothrix espanaensis]CCH35114.1 hypothetical protein BN6_78960 [Saccharothrix espanaensis DSM 44229]